MPKAQETCLEIDLAALEHNYRHIRSKLGKETRFMSVVKAYAYGNDSIAIAKKLEELGTDYFAVVYTYEGERLREAGITKPILILHPQPVNFKSLIDNCLEPNLYSERVLKEFIELAEDLNLRDYPVHIKLNTGMNRLGFTEENSETMFQLLKNTGSVRLASVFSHLAVSEDWKEREFTLGQIYKFREIGMQVLREFEQPPLFHICNSSAIFNYPEAHFDMVRCGLGLYGFANDEKLNASLKPVGTLKTVISQIQDLKEGDSLGYGRKFIASKPTRIATLPLGHADGIKRIYGNGKAGVIINDEFAPILGNVCMDIIMVDVTEIDCAEGDEVIVFGGPQKTSFFAQAGGTVTYELITGISQRVKRIILPEK